MIDWADLRVFHELQRTGSLAGAARALGVDPSTVSRRLAALEHELGASLLRRTPRGFLATDAARRIAPLAAEIARSVEALETAALDDDRRAEGKVVLTTPEVFGAHFVAPRLAPFLASHPRLEVELRTDDSVVSLTQHRADLALRLVKPKELSLVSRRIAELRIALFASESYVARHGAQVAAGFADHEIILHAEPLASLAEARWLRVHASKARVALRVSGLSAMLSAAGAGIGIAALPVRVASSRPELRPIGPALDVPARPVHLVMHADRQRTARVRLLADFLSRALAEP